MQCAVTNEEKKIIISQQSMLFGLSKKAHTHMRSLSANIVRNCKWSNTHTHWNDNLKRKKINKQKIGLKQRSKTENVRTNDSWKELRRENEIK